MLEELLVTNLGIIEDARLEPGPGLVVVTGETGTGKTMLLGALRLLLGAPARRDLVGPAGDEAVVQARFGRDDGEVLVARRISRQGRSKAYLDGLMAPLRSLEDGTAGSVELVAQHDHLRLRKPAELRRMLDARLDDAGREKLGAYRAGWERLESLLERREAIGGDPRALQRELETARYQTEEIEAAGFSAGDDVGLQAQASRLRNAQAIIESLDGAATALGDSGAESSMDDAVLALTKASGLDPDMRGLLDQAVDLATLMAELRSEVTRAAAEVAAEPALLEEVEARLQTLGDLRRKYGATLQDVLEFGADAAERAAAIHRLLAEAEDLEADVVEAESFVAAAGAQLRAARREAGDALAAGAMSHLQELGFVDPFLAFEVSEAAAGPGGADKIVLRFASDAKLEPGPVGRIASGGELSRLVLALRLAAGVDDTSVAAFDEIDAGVGGAVALALGRKLAGLATRRQVLCVTHLPQVAAFASTHYVVERNADSATVTKVEGAARVAELSRMLAGMPESERGREHAAELLAAAALHSH